METIIVLGLFVLSIVIGALVLPRGLDLKKWSSWLYGAIMFGCYFIIGFLATDIKVGLEAGAIAALLFMYSGAMRNWQKKLFRK